MITKIVVRPYEKDPDQLERQGGAEAVTRWPPSVRAAAASVTNFGDRTRSPARMANSKRLVKSW